MIYKNLEVNTLNEWLESIMEEDSEPSNITIQELLDSLPEDYKNDDR